MTKTPSVQKFPLDFLACKLVSHIDMNISCQAKERPMFAQLSHSSNKKTSIKHQKKKKKNPITESLKDIQQKQDGLLVLHDRARRCHKKQPRRQQATLGAESTAGKLCHTPAPGARVTVLPLPLLGPETPLTFHSFSYENAKDCRATPGTEQQ